MKTDINPLKDVAIRDESLFTGTAHSASSPETVEDVCQIVRHCRDTGETITVHGSLTAMNGAGVPILGHSMGLERLCQVSYDAESQTVWAQAGASFQKIEQMVHKQSRMTREFPASPTEKTATLGGALSFDTCGIRSLRYGSVSHQVLELEYCDNAGQLHRIPRESGEFPLLLGSEGMYGILTGARLATVPRPNHVWALLFFFPAEEIAAAFGAKVETLSCVSALEYMDRACLTLLKTHGPTLSAIARLPEIPGNPAGAVYLELEGDTEAEIEETAEEILLCLEELGGDPDNSWSATEDEVTLFRDLHHAVSECINMKTAQAHSRDDRVTKLTYPICLTGENRIPTLNARRADLQEAGLDCGVFGHWGSSQALCIHIFAENGEAYDRAKTLLCKWYREDVRSGQAALHKLGIGKIYREIFCQEANAEVWLRCRAAKQKFDAENLFNPGNMFLDFEK